MRSILAMLFAILALAFLASCSTRAINAPSDQVTFNPANYQGCTTVPYYVDGERRGAFIDCKDKDKVAVMLDLNSDGNADMTYEAENVVGSDAAAIRAQVEQTFAEQGAEVSSDLIDAIVESLTKLR